MRTTSQAKMAARYGEPDASALATWSDTIDQLLDHRSVRAFSPEPLPDGLVETLIAAAQSAATSSNLQVWSVVAVQEPERKARLSAFYQREGMKANGWLEQVVNRLQSAASLHGREHLVDELIRMGFGLR
jgi:nitroreductase